MIIRSCVVCINVEMISVDVQFGPNKHDEEFCQYHNHGEELFVTHSVFQLGIIKCKGPAGHRFVVLENIYPFLIAGSVSEM